MNLRPIMHPGFPERNASDVTYSIDETGTELITRKVARLTSSGWIELP